MKVQGIKTDKVHNSLRGRVPGCSITRCTAVILTTKTSTKQHLLLLFTIQVIRQLTSTDLVVPVHPIPPVRSPPPMQQAHVYNAALAPGHSLPPNQPQYAQQFGNFLGVNDATAQMGLHVVGSMMGSSQEYIDQNVSRFFNTRTLKPFFNVSTSYVVRKLQLLLFPWRHKPWSRQMRRNEVSGATEGYKPPREDINAPDLYIPGIFPSHTLPRCFPVRSNMFA